ncbi:hypothetical protein TNCV_2452161 [Trichonephila clavipes]|nr:hypothetical protein TNCV_2452161 [Trichonephila clavipes]
MGIGKLLIITFQKSGGGSWRIAITPIEKAEVIADSLQVQFELTTSLAENFRPTQHDEVTNFINTPHVQEIEPHSNGSLILRTETQAQLIPLDQISNRMIKN